MLTESLSWSDDGSHWDSNSRPILLVTLRLFRHLLEADPEAGLGIAYSLRVYNTRGC